MTVFPLWSIDHNEVYLLMLRMDIRSWIVKYDMV